MVTGLTRRLGRPEGGAFEPEVRKPCLLLDGSDHLRSGKGRVASSAEIGVRAGPESVVQPLPDHANSELLDALDLLNGRSRAFRISAVQVSPPLTTPSFLPRKLIFESVEAETVFQEELVNVLCPDSFGL